MVFLRGDMAGAFMVPVRAFVVHFHSGHTHRGVQCFKFASLAFCPFGKHIRYGGGSVSTIANIIWLIVSGIPLAASAVLNGLLLCVTIIGIPFGQQCFKFAKLALSPFGASVY